MGFIFGVFLGCDVPVAHNTALPLCRALGPSSPEHELPCPAGDGPAVAGRGTGCPKWVALSSECRIPGAPARREEQ